MTSTVPGETPGGKEELLAQLRELVPSAFLDGELDRNALFAALSLDDESKPAFSFTWPGIDRARHDARVPRQPRSCLMSPLPCTGRTPEMS